MDNSIKNKNILVLTSIYVADDIPKVYSPVVHYFCKHWVSQGYNVKVIHNISYFPKIFYLIPRKIKNIFEYITGIPAPDKRFYKKLSYSVDNVEVLRFPMFKLFPHAKFKPSVLRNQISIITKELDKVNFTPNIIIGHWFNPQLDLLFYLKEIYSGCKTCFISHDSGSMIKKLYGPNYSKFISSLDVIGYRSNEIKLGFEKEFGVKSNSFICHSGIPKNYFDTVTNQKRIPQKFIFVGTMIKRKYPLTILKALFNTQIDFTIEFIGLGKEFNTIKSFVENNNLHSQVSQHGYMDRIEVKKYLKQSDVFIMISKNEAFGLVYLEAMACGCIVVASRGGSFDGIINDGINGFLCGQGNQEELECIIKKISMISTDQKKIIRNNAIHTAKMMTDDIVAKNYINNIIKL